MDTDRNQCGLILASQSPRRKSLLLNAGLDFKVVPAAVDEPPYSSEYTPAEYARNLAVLKAEHVAQDYPDHWVIGGDTIVVTGDRVLGKPASADDAFEMLSLLNGKSHKVITGFAVLSGRSKKRVISTVETQVTFKKLSSQEIKGYIDSGEPFGKAGAYAIQGLGSILVREIEGSYTNVVGLPVCEVVDFLGTIGISPF
jgi:septum formation protein